MQQFADGNATLPFEILPQVAGDLLPRQAAFALDTLFEGGERIGHDSQPRAVDREVVILRPAVRNIPALLQRPVTQQIEQQFGFVVFLVFQMVADAFGRRVNGPVQMAFEPAPKRSGRRLRVRGQQFVIGYLEDLRHIDLHQIVHRIFQPRQRHPVTADGNPAAGQLRTEAVAHETLDKGLVARKAGPAVLIADQAGDSRTEQLGVESVVDPHGDVERRVDLPGRFEHQKGDARSLIPARFVGASQLPVDRIVDQQAGQVINGLVIGHSERLVPFVIGSEQRVDLRSRPVAVVRARSEVIPDDPLAGFAQGLGRTVQDIAVDLRHGEQVVAPPGIGFFGSQPFGLGNVASDPSLHAPDGPFVQVVEMLLPGRRIQFPAGGDLLQQAAPAQFEPHPVVGCKMGVVADSADDVVAGDVRLQVVVGIGRIPLVGTHFGHEIHPPSGKGVIRIDVDRMHGHQAAKIVRPGVEAVERSVGVVGPDLPKALRGHDPPVIVLVEHTFPLDLVACLPQFAGTQVGKFLVVVHLSVFI